jgi:hypothetical protein
MFWIAYLRQIPAVCSVSIKTLWEPLFHNGVPLNAVATLPCRAIQLPEYPEIDADFVPARKASAWARANTRKPVKKIAAKIMKLIWRGSAVLLDELAVAFQLPVHAEKENRPHDTGHEDTEHERIDIAYHLESPRNRL